MKYSLLLCSILMTGAIKASETKIETKQLTLKEIKDVVEPEIKAIETKRNAIERFLTKPKADDTTPVKEAADAIQASCAKLFDYFGTKLQLTNKAESSWLLSKISAANQTLILESLKTLQRIVSGFYGNYTALMQGKKEAFADSKKELAALSSKLTESAIQKLNVLGRDSDITVYIKTSFKKIIAHLQNMIKFAEAQILKTQERAGVSGRIKVLSNDYNKLANEAKALAKKLEDFKKHAQTNLTALSQFLESELAQNRPESQKKTMAQLRDFFETTRKNLSDNKIPSAQMKDELTRNQPALSLFTIIKELTKGGAQSEMDTFLTTLSNLSESWINELTTLTQWDTIPYTFKTL